MRGSTFADDAPADPAEALVREVGAQLRQVRLDRGEDLNDVAQQLRIKSAYLSGIEQGDLSGLPGRTYALGFLRTYADYLGFDGEDLTARIKSSVGELTDRTRLRIRTPMPENRLPKMPMVVISLAVVAAIYLGWSYVNRHDRMLVDVVAEVPSELRAPAGDGSIQSPGGRTPPVSASGSEIAATSDAASGPVVGLEAAEAPDSRVDEGQGARDAAGSTAAPGSGSASSAAGSRASVAVAATDPARLPDDAPERIPGQAGSPVDSDAGALTVQPAAGGGEAGPEPTGQRSSGGADANPQQALVAPPRAAIDRPETAPRAPAEPSDQGAGVNPAREAVAQLLEAAARGGQGAPRVYEKANIDARVILRAREPSWVRVSSPAGDYSFTRTLEPGEALLVPDRQGLELWTGNAPGLEIIVDGTPVTLPRGRVVRRNVSLDPDRLLQTAGPPR
jgi:cytoskeletal protein RodZ